MHFLDSLNSDYCTKNEHGVTPLLKKINEEGVKKGEPFKETLKKLSKALDKGREVGIQESIYRSLGLPLTKFSSVVKFINSHHPEHREGLLRSQAELENLSEGESVFHNSIHTYYEARPFNSEGDETDWDDMTLSYFAANYDIVYNPSQRKNVIKLRDKKGFIVKRGRECVIRYFLKHEHEQEYYRALCVLFLPFRQEMRDIHSKDVVELYYQNEKEIDEQRHHFEKNLKFSELLERAEEEKLGEKDPDADEENEDEFVEDETTEKESIEDFIKGAESQAKKAISNYKAGLPRMSTEEFLQKVSQLNAVQRKVFDDFCERMLQNVQEPDPFYLYIAGEAGTGKSFLVKLMIEFMHRLEKSSGQDPDKPTCLVLAPTGVAAFIVGGVTIESGLGMSINRKRSHVPSSYSVNANLKFLYTDLLAIFIDEISMVGDDKHARTNYMLQHIFGNTEYMGGISVVATGDFGQLPPVGENMIWHNSQLDGRPELAPNHWDVNFTICYLKEKMRSQDPQFSQICDKIRQGICDKEVNEYCMDRVKSCPNEDDNDSYAKGKLSIIVTGNAEREDVNLGKIWRLCPSHKVKYYTNFAVDVPTNLKNPPPLDPNLPLTQTGQLEQRVLFCQGAPVMMTSNHSVKRHKNNGLVNGARGYIDSIKPSKDDPDVPEIIFVRFNDDTTGQLFRRENLGLTNDHKPNDPLAVPILRQKKKFNARQGNTGWMRDQFPLTLCYAITSHKVKTFKEITH